MESSVYNVGGVALPRPFKLRRLGHVGLFQENLQAAEHFYIDRLGFRATDQLRPDAAAPPIGLFATFGSDHHALVCIDGNLVKGRDPGYDSGITVNQLSFQVGSLAEMVEGYHYLKERDVSIWRVGRDFPGSNWAVYGRDPDGYLVELYYGMEQIGWDRRSKPHWMRARLEGEPSLPQPSEMQEVLKAESGDHDGALGFRPTESGAYSYDVGGILLERPFKINKLGPVHLFVDDIAKSVAFYTDMMGMSIVEESEFEGQRVVFLRIGSDHHVLGLFPVALRARLGFRDNTKLMHLCVELSSYRQLLDAVRYLDESGQTRGPSLPAELRPGIDHSVSYLDPAGHAVLLYFSMEQIGWDGKPRPAAERRQITSDWPEMLTAASDTYMDQIIQGPAG